MLRLIAQRIGLGVLTLWFVSVLVFAGTEILPGDVASAVLGQSATAESLRSFRAELGLERPAYQRYASWLAHFVEGDLGQSFSSQRPVSALLRERLANTLWLAGLTALCAVPLSLGLGIAAAMTRNSLFDRSVNIGSLISISLPEFLIAYLLVYALAVQLGLFPAIARTASDAGLIERLRTLALPVATLTAATLAHMMRMTRAAIISVLSASYIETAILKGVPHRRIILRHALPNALGPIITVVAFNLAYFVVGIIVVEVAFAYPGMGQLMVDAVTTRDIPLVQACTMIFASTYVVLNLAADVAATLANPRLRLPR